MPQQLPTKKALSHINKSKNITTSFYYSTVFLRPPRYIWCELEKFSSCNNKIKTSVILKL